MRKLLSLFIALFVVSGLCAQQMPVLLPKYYKPVVDTVNSEEENKEDNKSTLMKPGKKLDYGVTLGTSFSSFSGYGSMNSNYIAPHINYQVSPDFHLSFDAVYVDNNYSGQQVPISYNGYSMSYLGTEDSWGVSLGGVYKLSEKFDIFGSGSYYANNGSDQLPAAYQQQDYKSLSLGVNYKISKNASIGVQFNYNNGLPYYNNFYNNMTDPYRNSLFNTPY